MKHLRYIITLIFIISIQSAFADTKTAGVEKVDLSFEQSYALMLNNNNSLKAYETSVKKGKYEKRSAVGQFLPKVVLNSTYIHFSDNMTLTSTASIPGLPLTATANTLIQDKNLFTVGGGVVWNVFTGGKLLSNNAAARAKLNAANSKYSEILDNLTLDLVKRYYGLRLARDVVEVRKQVYEGLEQHLKDAKLLEAEGIISKAERLHADVAFSDAQRDYKAALRDANIIEEGLKVLIKDDKANLKNVYIEPASLLFVYNDSTIDVNAMKENALQNNPQLKQLQAKKDIMNAKFHATAANYLPTVSLFAYDIAGASNLSEAVPRAAIGGSVNWVLFDGLSRYNDTKAADCDRKIVDFELKDANYNIESLVVKQYEELMKSKERYESSTKAIEDAQEALRTATLAFKEGLGTSLQVTDAQLMLSKVKIERLNAIYNYDVALTELLKTNGDTKEILNYISKSQTEEF